MAAYSFVTRWHVPAPADRVWQVLNDFEGYPRWWPSYASSRKDSADAVKTEADSRRQATESVNLDEELVNLTTYQQAFNASARMIQATKELFDVLNNII